VAPHRDRARVLAGGGLAVGTIALVSHRYGAGAFDEVGVAVRASAALVVAVTVPVAAAFWLFPTELVSLLTDDARAIELGARYLEVLAVGVPFAGLNPIGSRIYIGADDAWTPMLVRAGGALANIALNAAFIFGLGMGVTGAALGTVLANVVVTGAFAAGLIAGRLPGAGELSVQVDPFGSYLHVETMRDLVTIGLPVVGRNTVWTVAKFPMLAIVGLFGPSVVAAYVIARRIWALMNTPGWGFGLASSSLVGQALGEGDEPGAESYARDVIALAVVTYAVAAVLVAALAEPIVGLFVGDARDPAGVPRRDDPAGDRRTLSLVPRGDDGPGGDQLLPVLDRRVEGDQPGLPARRGRRGRLTEHSLAVRPPLGPDDRRRGSW
jgi:putative MATE family efflux protein